MNESLLRLLLLSHLAATLFMTGLIWFVQIVHYPLFARTGDAEFPAYQQRHATLTTWVVGPLMLVEASTASLLLWLQPAGFPTWPWLIGLGLVVIIWLSTAFLQVPCHNRLSCRFDPAAHHRLVQTNWGRTTAWTVRSLLVLYIASL